MDDSVHIKISGLGGPLVNDYGLVVLDALLKAGIKVDVKNDHTSHWPDTPIKRVVKVKLEINHIPWPG